MLVDFADDVADDVIGSGSVLVVYVQWAICRLPVKSGLYSGYYNIDRLVGQACFH